MEQTLTTAQIVKLRALAQGLEAHVRLGKQGLSSALLSGIENELVHHELIKVRILDRTADKHRLAEEMAAASRSTVVTIIGNVVVLFRQPSDSSRRKIAL